MVFMLSAATCLLLWLLLMSLLSQQFSASACFIFIFRLTLVALQSFIKMMPYISQAVVVGGGREVLCVLLALREAAPASPVRVVCAAALCRGPDASCLPRPRHQVRSSLPATCLRDFASTA